MRAPELVLGLPFDHRIDIWSFGCLAFGFIAGTGLFAVGPLGGERAADDNYLIQMIEVLGPLPEHLAAKWPRYKRYFDASGVKIRSSVAEVDESTDQPHFTFESLEGAFEAARPVGCDDRKRDAIIGLLRRMLQYNPDDRASAAELLKCPWFDAI